MSTAENKELVRRFTEAINSHNLDAFDDILGEDYDQHNPQVGPGREGAKQFFGMLFSAFPDTQITLEDTVAEDDKVVARWTMTGTHQGAFLGIPATGRSFKMGGVDIWRTANGKAVEHWDMVDNLGLMQQLGVIPMPGQPPH